MRRALLTNNQEGINHGEGRPATWRLICLPQKLRCPQSKMLGGDFHVEKHVRRNESKGSFKR